MCLWHVASIAWAFPGLYFNAQCYHSGCSATARMCAARSALWPYMGGEAKVIGERGNMQLMKLRAHFPGRDIRAY